MREDGSALTASAEEIAFQDIFRQHYRLVYAIATRALGAGGEAEEVAQETFKGAADMGPFGSASPPSIWMLVYAALFALVLLMSAISVFSKRDL